MTKPLEQRIYDGDQARLVLENEAFAAAFADIRTEIVEQWTNSPARAKDDRESLWNLLKLADKLEATLRLSLEDGKMAQLELQHKQSMFERAKALIG
jgi:predicted TPR repeat methyltransferase